MSAYKTPFESGALVGVDLGVSDAVALAKTPGAGISDDTDLARPCRGIYVGTSAGADLAVTMISGNSVTFVGVLPGKRYPFHCSRVLDTGTTATNLLALY